MIAFGTEAAAIASIFLNIHQSNCGNSAIACEVLKAGVLTRSKTFSSQTKRIAVYLVPTWCNDSEE